MPIGSMKDFHLGSKLKVILRFKSGVVKYSPNLKIYGQKVS